MVIMGRKKSIVVYTYIAGSSPPITGADVRVEDPLPSPPGRTLRVLPDLHLQLLQLVLYIIWGMMGARDMH